MLPTEQTTTAVPHVNTSSACAGAGVVSLSFVWSLKVSLSFVWSLKAAWQTTESLETSGELLNCSSSIRGTGARTEHITDPDPGCSSGIPSHCY